MSLGKLAPQLSYGIGKHSRSTSTFLRWQPLHSRLQDRSTHRFREEAFVPASPALTPLGYFKHLPAIRKWFLRTSTDDFNERTRFNESYMNNFGAAIVPLEFSRSSNRSSSRENEEYFQRLEAPLKIFLDWASNATVESKDRIYVAQASLQALPQSLRVDLPTPDLVSEAGRGDVYDTNIWLGLPPTYTPLHRDPNPNLFVQLAGQKMVRLLPPDAGQEIFYSVQTALGTSNPARFRGDEMMKGREKTLLETAIWSDLVPDREGSFVGHEAQLSAGDGIFIPKGWWHSIKGIGLGVTGSVSANFILSLWVRPLLNHNRLIGGSGKLSSDRWLLSSIPNSRDPCRKSLVHLIC